MNTLKSVFVSLYLAAAVAVTVFAVRSLVNSQDYLAWGG
ncbi:MAG: AhpC/TSA family protein, partial [Gammaproteobacteria bacterium]|nr:AhpC/TSA family protein [Gammaproteobacteria bacterium]